MLKLNDWKRLGKVAPGFQIYRKNKRKISDIPNSFFHPPERWVSGRSLFQSLRRNLHVEGFAVQLLLGSVVDVLQGFLEDVLIVAAAGRTINILKFESTNSLMN